jgi:hypothetical protein
MARICWRSRVFALLLAHFGARVGSDLVAEFEDLQLVREVGVHVAQRVGATGRLKQRLLFREVHAEHGCEHVNQPHRIVIEAEQFTEFGGILRRLRTLGDADRFGAEFEQGACERFDFGSGIGGHRERRECARGGTVQPLRV